MHGICQLNTITWTSPWNRFLWEGVCGLVGPFLTIIITALVVIIVIAKIADSK